MRASTGPVGTGPGNRAEDCPHADADASDLTRDNADIAVNTSANEPFDSIAQRRLTRRALLGATASLGALAALGERRASAQSAAPQAISRFDFTEVSARPDATHHIPEGYRAQVLMRWGDAVEAEAPQFDPLRQTPQAQARQFGYNNDFVGYFPLPGDNAARRNGLLVVNHEYVNEELMFPAGADAPDAAARVGIAKAAHGGSAIEIAREGMEWRVVSGSRYARRITATTPMDVAGPAAGHPRLRTSADPSGARIAGMLNNCAGGQTPWGTWLTCEENFDVYFGGTAPASEAARIRRLGPSSGRYDWRKVDARFDLAAEPNEFNRFGWVVEIDPFDPQSTPVKRTAIGRFKHEGAAGASARDGRYVVYCGDDQRNEYVYRFVTRDRVNADDRAANRALLDHGVLSVARFDADGTGRWLPLVFGEGPLTPENGFASQADVVIDARLAADRLGATPMDRPEDIEANPLTGKVYVVCTNNNARRAGQENAANPRAPNTFGHILEITPDGDDHAAPTFRWDALVLCGDPADPKIGATFNKATSADGWFGMPDNLAFDARGRLWVATDGMSVKTTGRNDGLFALETQGASRGTARRFFQVPNGAEMCGPCFTPDDETLFLAVQHPGEDLGERFGAPAWPDFQPGMPPRPSVLAITREGGGKIG